MNSVITSARFIGRWSKRCIFALLIFTALLLILLRTLLPALAESYRPEIEQTLSTQLGASVAIDKLEIRWWGWGPVLEIHGFSLRDPGTYTRLINFHQARARLDVSHLLQRKHPVVRDIHLLGEDLLLQYSKEAGLQLVPHKPLANAETTDPGLVNAFLDWLTAIDDIHIAFDRLEIRHAQSNQASVIGRQLKLHLYSGIEQRRLDADFTLIEPAKQPFQARFDLTQVENDWQVDFYLNGKGLNLENWPLAKAAGLRKSALAGRADLQIWGLWRAHAFQEITGQAKLRKGRVAESVLPQLVTHFDWRPTAQGWQWRSDWRAPSKSLNSRIDITMANNRLRGEARHLPAKLLADMASPWLQPAQAAVVQNLEPEGELTELVFAYSPGDSGYELASRFQDLSTQAWRRTPGIASLNGQFALNRAGASIVLDSRAVVLDWPMLRAPVPVKTLHGALRWRRYAVNGVLSSQSIEDKSVLSRQNTEANSEIIIPALYIGNDDLTARLSGNIRLQTGQPPRLDLKADYQDVNIAQIYRYLPAAIMNPKLLSWLDHSLVSGVISKGDLVFHGSGRDFPFDNKQGVFETRFQVEDMVFAYRDRWPPIEKLNAEVIFRNRQFTANSHSGQIMQAQLDKVYAHIADMENAALDINGKAHGPGAGMLRFLSESPLQEKLGKYVADMSVSGDNSLGLDLHIPLKRDEKTQKLAPVEVEGRIGFSGGSVKKARQNVELANIRGTVDFSEKMLRADDLEVVFRGDPAILSLATKNRGNSKEMQFHLRGKLGLRALFDKAEPVFSPYINGKSHWDVLVTIPESRHDRPASYTVELKSLLQGTSVDLPAPLAKGKATKRPIAIRADIRESQAMQLDIGLDETHHALLAFTKTRGEMRFERGELRLNSGRATLPETPGLAITGRLARYSALSMGAAKQTQTLPAWFNRLDARIDQLTAGRYILYDTGVQISRDNDSIRTILNGRDVAGEILIPAKPTASEPLELRLRHLSLRSPQHPPVRQAALLKRAENTAQKPDPRQIPPLHATIDKLYMNNGFLGQAEILLIPDETGIKLQELTLQSEQQRIAANGAWETNGDRQQSRLEATLYSARLGKTLSALDYDLGLQGAETTAEIALSWSGGFTDIDLPSLQGSGSFSIGTGQLLDIDPGIGRMVGLFNLYSLTRRLRLDFSDLFDTGLAFDRIDGQINFAKGIAHTEAITLQGPSANIIITGTTELNDRTYDQTITVMPQLGTPLAIAGALAGGPIVGAAVFFADRLGLSNAVRYEYTVTGAWENPSIEPIRPAENSDNSGWIKNR